MIKKLFSLLAVYVLCNSITGYSQHIFPVEAVLDTTLVELPAIGENDNIIIHSGYTVSFNPFNRIPEWVAYELTSGEVLGDEARSGSFVPDPAFPGPQANTRDYTRSGYDRGHMAPAADMKWSKDAMRESFYLTNVCPQTPELNRRNWLRLEDKTRSLAMEYDTVWVVCGPMLDESDTLWMNEKVLIPHAFFKAVVVHDGESYRGAAFIMQNNDEEQPLDDVCMTVFDLEAVLQKDLFRSINGSTLLYLYN